MARVELPESKLKARRRRARLRIGLLLGVVGVVLAGGVVVLAHAAVVRISTIGVFGAQTIASSTIVAQVQEALDGSYLWLIPRDTIFVYPKRAIAVELLKTYPTLSSAEVHAIDFHTIAVAVVERQPRALWCSATGSCFFMDENGVIYAPAPTFSAPVYTEYYGTAAGYTLPKQFLTAADFAALAALVDAIVQKLPDEQLSGVVVDGNPDVQLRFADGFTLHFALHDQGGDVFERFSLVLTSDVLRGHTFAQLEYLDLRFGDKLYYKLK